MKKIYNYQAAPAEAAVRFTYCRTNVIIDSIIREPTRV